MCLVSLAPAFVKSCLVWLSVKIAVSCRSASVSYVRCSTITVAFCSLMSRAASVMNCSGFCLYFANVEKLILPRIFPAVRRVSCVFSAISPSRSYATCDPAETVSVCVVVALTANPAPLVRSSASSAAICWPDCTTYCIAATLRAASSAETHLSISSVESNSTW